MTVNHSQGDENQATQDPSSTQPRQSPHNDADKKHGSIDDYLCHVALCDRQNAISFVETYLPEVAAEFDAKELVVETPEFYNEFLTKKTLDFAYAIPSKKDADEELLLTVALEHKSHGGARSELETLEQLFYYFALLCRRHRFERKSDSASNAPKPSPRRREPKRAQPLVVLLYTGKNLNYEPPQWEDYYPLPQSLSRFQVRFPILCVNWTKAYREGRINGDPLVNVPASLLSAAALKELPEALTKIFAEINKLPPLGDRERSLLNAYITYVVKAYNNAGLAVNQRDLDSIFNAVENPNRREEMETIVGDIFLDARRESHAQGVAQGVALGVAQGVAQGRIAAILQMLTFKFGSPDKKAVESLEQIKDSDRLVEIFDYVMRSATSLADAERFIQEKSDH